MLVVGSRIEIVAITRRGAGGGRRRARRRAGESGGGDGVSGGGCYGEGASLCGAVENPETAADDGWPVGGPKRGRRGRGETPPRHGQRGTKIVDQEEQNRCRKANKVNGRERGRRSTRTRDGRGA
jgi:hypothetical protein